MDRALGSKRERNGRINLKMHQNEEGEYLKHCYELRNA
jgi:hypothetical protein